MNEVYLILKYNTKISEGQNYFLLAFNISPVNTGQKATALLFHKTCSTRNHFKEGIARKPGKLIRSTQNKILCNAQ